LEITMKYAIIRSGGRQYRCTEGQSIEVDRLPVEAGATHTFTEVLLLANDGAVSVGAPTVAGAAVSATVIGEVKGPKVIAFRYKAKERQRRKRGHRQKYTRLTINTIEG
jgi:large subunit ribosomal protein L21